MREKAIEQGWERHYERSADFRAIFDELCIAVASLPTDLLARAGDLSYPQLHRACVDGDLELVRALLVRGVSSMSYVFSDDDQDRPPLAWLAEEQMEFATKVAVADLLFEFGADPDEGDALELANDQGDSAFAAYLRARGAAG